MYYKLMIILTLQQKLHIKCAQKTFVFYGNLRNIGPRGS